MEASPATSQRVLPGEKADRIIEAMRHSVAERGVAGSTFDHVAREAGVSRGLLHYYFGTKERLLVEVVRREADSRLAALDRQLAGAADADAFLHLLSVNADAVLRTDPTFMTLNFELFTLAQRNEEVAAGYRELVARTQAHLAETLRTKEREGVLHLNAEADAIAEVLLSLADGLSMRIAADPGRDVTDVAEAMMIGVRALIVDA